MKLTNDQFVEILEDYIKEPRYRQAILIDGVWVPMVPTLLLFWYISSGKITSLASGSVPIQGQGRRRVQLWFSLLVSHLWDVDLHWSSIRFLAWVGQLFSGVGWLTWDIWLNGLSSAIVYAVHRVWLWNVD